MGAEVRDRVQAVRAWQIAWVVWCGVVLWGEVALWGVMVWRRWWSGTVMVADTVVGVGGAVVGGGMLGTSCGTLSSAVTSRA